MISKNRTMILLVELLVCILWVGMGCSASDPTGPSPLSDVQDAYWTLGLNYHALTLHVDDTVQLEATPRSPTGQALPGSQSAVFYVVNNDTSVQLGQTGLLRAHSVRTGVRIVATLTHGGVTLRDTAIVNVVKQTTEELPATFSMQPIMGDSTKIEPNTTKDVSVRILDAATNPLAGVVAHYWSADTTLAKFSNSTMGTVTGGLPPHTVMLYADAYIFGHYFRDSVLMIVQYPYAQTLPVGARIPIGTTTPVSYFQTNSITTRVGGIIIWVNLSGQPVDVVFDDSAEVGAAPDGVRSGLMTVSSSGGGNIPAWDGASVGTPMFDVSPFGHYKPDSVARSRSFPGQGTFGYHSRIYGTRGTVKVVDDPHS